MKKQNYSSEMLPGINYLDLSDDELDEELVDLECNTQEILCRLSEGIKEIMQDAGMITVDKLIVAHLSAYLGFISITELGEGKTKEIINQLIKIMTREAKHSYKLFLKFPITPNIKNKKIRSENFEKLRNTAPGSIAAQTVKLGRVIFDLMEELYCAKKESNNNEKQDEFFVPPIPFTILLKTLCNDVINDLNEYGDEKSVLYHINHTAVQIGWLIGYYNHLNQSNDISSYVEYISITMKSYINFGIKFINIPIEEMQMRYEEMENTDSEFLIKEATRLSKKIKSSEPCPITKHERDAAIVMASMEKVLHDLIMEKIPCKIIVLSLFHFWITLEAPMRGVKNDSTGNLPPYKENAIAELIGIIVKMLKQLPQYNETKTKKNLGKVINSLKSEISAYELDNVNLSRNELVAKTARVNERIYGKTCELLKQSLHPVIIANVLFGNWIRLSTIGNNMPEESYQKIEYYFTEIIEEVRKHIPNLFKK